MTRRENFTSCTQLYHHRSSDASSWSVKFRGIISSTLFHRGVRQRATLYLRKHDRADCHEIFNDYHHFRRPCSRWAVTNEKFSWIWREWCIQRSSQRYWHLMAVWHAGRILILWRHDKCAKAWIKRIFSALELLNIAVSYNTATGRFWELPWSLKLSYSV